MYSCHHPALCVAIPRRGERMFRRLLALLSVSACASAVMVLAPISAQAQSAVTISLGSTGTIAKSKVLVTLPVQITCDLTAGQPGPIGTPFTVEDDASIAQAAGRAIATGTGFADRSAVVCDCTPHRNTITLVADSTGPPFHGGHATVQYQVLIFDNNGNTEQANTGFVTISLNG